MTHARRKRGGEIDEMKTTHRIVGQGPKLWSADGRYLRPVRHGEVLGTPQITDDLYRDDPTTRYITIDAGGGFEDQLVTHTFRASGTVVRVISRGDSHSYAVTEVDVPSA